MNINLSKFGERLKNTLWRKVEEYTLFMSCYTLNYGFNLKIVCTMLMKIAFIAGAMFLFEKGHPDALCSCSVWFKIGEQRWLSLPVSEELIRANLAKLIWACWTGLLVEKKFRKQLQQCCHCKTLGKSGLLVKIWPSRSGSHQFNLKIGINKNSGSKTIADWIKIKTVCVNYVIVLCSTVCWCGAANCMADCSSIAVCVRMGSELACSVTQLWFSVTCVLCLTGAKCFLQY